MRSRSIVPLESKGKCLTLAIYENIGTVLRSEVIPLLGTALRGCIRNRILSGKPSISGPPSRHDSPDLPLD